MIQMQATVDAKSSICTCCKEPKERKQELCEGCEQFGCDPEAALCLKLLNNG